MAPVIPSFAGVRINSAPRCFIINFRSVLTFSGITMTHSYPRTAAVKANAIPVFPLVGSMMMLSGDNNPAFSAALIIATPIRSLTLCAGLKYSSFSTIFATPLTFNRLRRTSGVLPINSVMSLYIFMQTPSKRSSFWFLLHVFICKSILQLKLRI